MKTDELTEGAISIAHTITYFKPLGVHPGDTIIFKHGKKLLVKIEPAGLFDWSSQVISPNSTTPHAVQTNARGSYQITLTEDENSPGDTMTGTISVNPNS